MIRTSDVAMWRCEIDDFHFRFFFFFVFGLLYRWWFRTHIALDVQCGVAGHFVINSFRYRLEIFEYILCELSIDSENFICISSIRSLDGRQPRCVRRISCSQNMKIRCQRWFHMHTLNGRMPERAAQREEKERYVLIRQKMCRGDWSPSPSTAGIRSKRYVFYWHLN